MNMKTTNILIAVFGFSLAFAAIASDDHKTKTDSMFCAKLKDGVVVVTHEGTEITSEVVLDDGTRIQTNGTVIKKDGSKETLKVGQCVDMKGNINVLPADNDLKSKEKDVKTTEKKDVEIKVN